MSADGADRPNVIQGRLGWEPGDISEADPSELEPHPKNDEIYGDTDDVADLEDSFLNSVRANGVLEPLVVTEGKRIISGHRRWLAASYHDLDAVPVRYTEFDSELDEREAIIECNRQREKSRWQKINEFDEMLELEQQRAARREQSGGKNGGEGSGNVSKPLEDTGAARDKAAERMGADVSGKTLEQGKKAKEIIDKRDDEQAKETKEKLQNDEIGFSTALDEVQNDDDSEQSEINEVQKEEDAFTDVLKYNDTLLIAIRDEKADWWQQAGRESTDSFKLDGEVYLLRFCGDDAKRYIDHGTVLEVAQ
jgi:ParB-like chromosome segregation protein Spo0J